jgi:hypothetical protein
MLRNVCTTPSYLLRLPIVVLGYKDIDNKDTFLLLETTYITKTLPHYTDVLHPKDISRVPEMSLLPVTIVYEEEKEKSIGGKIIKGQNLEVTSLKCPLRHLL